MTRVICRLFFGGIIAGATAFITVYAVEQEMTAAVAEVLSCILVAMFCADFE